MCVKNFWPISIKISVVVWLKFSAEKSYSWITRSFRLEISILNYELFNFRSLKVLFCDALINPAIPDTESSSATLAIVLIPISLKQVPIDTFVLPSNILLFINLHFYCQNKLFSRIQARWIRRNCEYTQPGILSKSLYIGRLMNARHCLI